MPKNQKAMRPKTPQYSATIAKLIAFVASEISTEQLSPLTDAAIARKAQAQKITATQTMVRHVREKLMIPTQHERYTRRLARAFKRTHGKGGDR